MIRKNLLNNRMMENNRHTAVYQTLVTDLAITGVMPVDTAEMLLGYKIPMFLCTPDKQHLDAVNYTAGKTVDVQEEAGKEDIEDKPAVVENEAAKETK